MPVTDLAYTYQNDWGSASASTTIQEVFNLGASPNPQDPHLISFVNELRVSITSSGETMAVVNFLTDSIMNYKLTVDGTNYIDYNEPAADVWTHAQNCGPLTMLTKNAGGDVRYEPFNVVTGSPSGLEIVFFWELPLGIAMTQGKQIPIQINQTIAALGAETSDWAGVAIDTMSSFSWKVWARYGQAEKTYRYGMTQKEIFSDSGETRPITLTQQQDMTILGVHISQDTVSDVVTEAHIRDGSVNQKSLELLRYLNGDYSRYVEVVNALSTGHETDNTATPEFTMYTNMEQVTGQLWMNTFGWPANTNLTMDVKSTGSTYFIPLYCAPIGAGSAGPVKQQFQQTGNVAADVIMADTEPAGGQVSASGSRGKKKRFGYRRR